MTKILGFCILAALMAGCGSGEPSGDIAPKDVKVEKIGSGSGPSPSSGAAAPVAQPPAGAAQTD